MKKMNRFMIILALLFSMGQLALAQRGGAKVLDGILKLKLQNTGPIIQKSIVKGYYLFYKVDKIDRKTNEYQLQILDENHNLVAKTPIIGPKYFHLLEGSYNGNSLMMKFYNSKERMVHLQRFGMDGKLISKVKHEVSKLEFAVYSSMLKEGTEGVTLHAVEGEGFLHFRTVKNKKYGYSYQFLPEKGKGKKWSINSPVASKQLEFANYLGQHGGTILSSVVRKKSMLSNNFTTYIQAVDLATGKKKFDTKMEHASYDIQIMNVVPFNGSSTIQLLGLYFKKGDNVIKDPSLGFCMVNLDENGKVTDSKYISWLKDVGKLMEVNQKGKLKGIGYVYFHKIVTDANGDIFLIGEQFKKTVSGLGVASNILNSVGGGGGASSNFQLTIDDMMIFRLSSDFKLKGIDIFAKSKSRIQLPAGAGINGPQLLALWMKSYGAFDYSFTQQVPDKSRFTVGFIDWDKEGKGRNQLVFGAITWNNGKFVTDKISLRTDATSLGVQPGKPGYVTLFEYYRKQKKLELRMEQINY